MLFRNLFIGWISTYLAMASMDMTSEEFGRLLDGTRTTKYRLIWRILAGTGLRSDELLTLKVKDINLEKRIIILDKNNTKSGKSRNVLIPKSLVADILFLVKDQEPEEYIFKGQTIKNGQIQPMTTRALRKAFYLACDNAGIERYSPHALRHYHATQSLKAGIDLNSIRLNLGHASLRTTQIYLSNNLEARREVLDNSSFEV